MCTVLFVLYFALHLTSHFQVAALPKGGDIEIEAVAIIGQWRFAFAKSEFLHVSGAVDVGSVLLNKTYLNNL